MIMPSSSACGSPSISLRFMYAPGSPSSALQMMYFCSPSALRRNSHLRPVRNPAPPRPRSLEALICSMTISGIASIRTLYKVLIDAMPEMVIEQIKASKLRGRGGAGFLTGLKWEFLRKAEGEQKYIICNADEGDPGAYMNRNEIEGDPHALLEGMIIGAYVTGATEGIVYVRAE